MTEPSDESLDERPVPPPSHARRLGRAVGRAASTAASGTRETIRRNPTADRVYRTGVGVVGGTTVALGVVLIPLPGPGSLIALGGLGLLATEFETAKKASTRANRLAKRAFDATREARARRAEARRDRDAAESGDLGRADGT